MAEFVTLARVSELHEERGLTVKREGREFALFKLGGEVFALNGQCPHRGGPLGEGLLEHGKVYCPLHGWQFDVRTGACEDNVERPARCFETRVVDGEVQVKI